MAAKRKNKQRSLNKMNTVLFSLSVSPKLQISDLLWPNQTLHLNPLLSDSHLSQIFNVDIKDLTNLFDLFSLKTDTENKLQFF